MIEHQDFEIYCSHCGTPCRASIVLEDKHFCCIGCRSVWSVLTMSGLGKYYEFREKLSLSGFIPNSDFDQGYEYFDDTMLLDEIVEKIDSERWKVDLILPEIYCAACVWLLEKLPTCDAGILECQVILGSKSVKITYNPNIINLSKIVKIIKSFGYSIDYRNRNETDNIYNKEDLSRLAVAVFSAMNCMMIAVSLYQGWWSGMDFQMKKFLEIVSAIISFPAVFYSAKPFIQRAYAGLMVKRISLDFPLAFGILLGYVFSIVSIIFNLGEVYFDSITVLIALLLVARFGTNYTLARFKKQGNILRSVFPEYAYKKEESETKEVFVKRLKVGDYCYLKSNYLVPADGKVVNGELLVDSSVLSGEVDPVVISAGGVIWGGTRIVSGEGLIELSKTQIESRFYNTLSKLSDNVELGSELIEKIDRRSSLFVAWVLCAMLLSFSYYWYYFDFVRAYEIALSIVVISCPCALGISVPFSFSSACLKASKEGIYFSSGGTIEKTTLCTKLILDKTGTATEGSFSEVEVIGEIKGHELETLMKKVYLLEIDQLHPIAKRITNYISSTFKLQSDIAITNKVVNPSLSIQGFFSDGSVVEVGSERLLEKISPNVLGLIFETNNQNKGTKIFVIENGIPQMLFILKDKIRSNMQETLSELKDEGFDIFILSGDQKQVVEEVGKTLKIKPANIFSQSNPEEKEITVRKIGDGTIMVGDGLNDIQALKAATVGVSVTGGLELLQKVGGVMITDFNSEKLKNFIEGAKLTVHAANINIRFSFLYNIIGTISAAMGYISPIVAAILMPISSLTVILIASFVPKFNFDKK